MIRRFLLASALLITGTIVAAPSAFAIDSQPLTFDGTIDQACAFGTPSTGGGISVASTTATSLSITPITTSVTCNYAAKLRVGAPSPSVGTSTLATIASSVTASGPGVVTDTTITDSSSTPIDLVTGKAAALSVSMTADNGTNVIPAGTYTYTVTLTATAL